MHACWLLINQSYITIKLACDNAEGCGSGLLSNRPMQSSEGAVPAFVHAACTTLSGDCMQAVCMHVCTFVCVIFRYGSMNQYCSFWEKQLICCLLLSNALLHPTITPTHYNSVCVKLPFEYRYVWSHSLSHRTPTSLVMICRLTNGDPMTLLKLQSISLSGSSPITR